MAPFWEKNSLFDTLIPILNPLRSQKNQRESPLAPIQRKYTHLTICKRGYFFRKPAKSHSCMFYKSFVLFSPNCGQGFA